MPAPVRLLLGPAGSGKTYRCLAEIRAALEQSPSGDPLVLVAPKQATYQLERQLLADGSLAGYTRLHILSFERLAEFLLVRLRQPTPPLLEEEGRVMVLRALLARHRDRLRLFRATARLPGLAQHLSLVLRELQQHQVTAQQLENLAHSLHREAEARSASVPEPPGEPLGAKLADLGLLLGEYLRWLKTEGLEDAGRLLDLATAALQSLVPDEGREPVVLLDALWLDGFAEMTPQELDLAASLARFCRRATFAFCVEASAEGGSSWLSPWALVGGTVRRLRGRLEPTWGTGITVETLSREPGRWRFRENAALQHLEAHWAEPRAWSETGKTGAASELPRLVACETAEAEAVVAAREILRFVRRGGRFREAAVIFRSLEGHHAVFRRVFERYGIPFFLDRREWMAHHPLAELTRYALRTIAFDWLPEDWFGVLKTGLVDPDDAAIDRLENEALARGWQGRFWLDAVAVPGAGGGEPGGEGGEGEEGVREVLARVVPPFAALTAAFAGPGSAASGRELAAALRELWRRLDVEETLAQWSLPAADDRASGGRWAPAAIHLTVFEQMSGWLRNLELGFGEERLPLSEWLPILEAGLSSLTVGVIPPALDQVLLGAIDRSRNPDLRLVILAGLNEGGFPARPPAPLLLTTADRERLRACGVDLGPDRRGQLGREHYFGYIACTRAAERLVVTWAERDGDDRPLNPSPFVAHLGRLFPSLPVERESAEVDWRLAEHPVEAVGPLLAELQGAGAEAEAARAAVPAVREVLDRLGNYRVPEPSESLDATLARRLYGGTVLRTSVSRLEDFAACPFKFFLSAGLRAEERRRFEVDARQTGSFQHDVLARFHGEVRAAGRQWSDLTPPEARAWVGRIAQEHTQRFGAGLFVADDRSLLTARALERAVQDFVEVVVNWMQTAYGFEPAAVELAFGGGPGGLPAWELELEPGLRLAIRGKIDRVDVERDAAGNRAWYVVLDYKSGARRIQPVLLEHGIQMQLPAYLAALRALPTTPWYAEGSFLVPAGVFYAPLRRTAALAGSRTEAFEAAEADRRSAYQHRGRFRTDALPALDRQWSGDSPSGQFSYPAGLKKAGRQADPMSPEAFEALLDGVTAQIRRLGQAIAAGVAAVDPYALGASQTACQQCDYAAICRIDRWTHRFRRLGAGPEDTAEE